MRKENSKKEEFSLSGRRPVLSLEKLLMQCTGDLVAPRGLIENITSYSYE
jgi:hypothetical protein